jgi:hypothetical protein
MREVTHVTDLVRRTDSDAYLLYHTSSPNRHRGQANRSCHPSVSSSAREQHSTLLGRLPSHDHDVNGSFNNVLVLVGAQCGVGIIARPSFHQTARYVFRMTRLSGFLIVLYVEVVKVKSPHMAQIWCPSNTQRRTQYRKFPNLNGLLEVQNWPAQRTTNVASMNRVNILGGFSGVLKDLACDLIPTLPSQFGSR